MTYVNINCIVLQNVINFVIKIIDVAWIVKSGFEAYNKNSKICLRQMLNLKYKLLWNVSFMIIVIILINIIK